MQSGLMAIDVSGFHQIASYERPIQTEGERVGSSGKKEDEGMKLSLNIEMHAWSATSLSRQVSGTGGISLT